MQFHFSLTLFALVLIETLEQIKLNYPCFPKEFSLHFLVMKRNYYPEINVVLL
jgi:hypothetical protein